MSRRTWYCVVVSLSLLSPFLQPVLSAAEAIRQRHEILVSSGEAAPAGGNYSPFSFINATLNARGAMAFDAVLGGPPTTTGVFVRDARTTSAIALGVNPDPAAPSFGTVLNPFITRDGDVVFEVNFSDVYRSNGTTIVPLVRLGDPAPGGGTVTSLQRDRAVDDLGRIAYVAHLTGAAAMQAIFRTDGMQTTTIAGDDRPAPTGGSFTALLSPAMNDRGQVAFKSEMKGGSADHGIFLGDGNHLLPVFVANQVAPGGGTIDDCGTPAINAQGQVVAICLLTNAVGGAGVFVSDGWNTVPIALAGRPAPTGGAYDGVFTGTTRLNDRGEVAFQARLTGGTFGMFRGNGKHTTTVALTGTGAPGTAGIFQSFGDLFELDNNGRVVFVATLATGTGGVDASNNTGIWIGTSDQDLRLLVRTGDVIDGKVVTELPFAGTSAGHPLDMNENRVLWRGNLGPAKALVISRVDDDSGGGE